MNNYEFDYDAFFDGTESVDTLSNDTTSPAISPKENDLDSGIAYGSQVPTGLDNTVINLDDLDIFPLNMESPLSDDSNDDFNCFSALFADKNLFMSDDNSTFKNLFPDVELSAEQIRDTSQQIPSQQSPTIVPKSAEIHAITNCIKIQPYTNTASSGVPYIKLEPINPNSNIKIIQTSKPITFANVPVIKMPLKTTDLVVKSVNTVAIPSAKRRRSDSISNHQETCENSTLTLDQLRLQYGNMSEEALKKHLRMIKNRESASLSRKRRKELMENLDVKVKELTDENEKLKKENSKLLTRMQTLEIENELLKKYAGGNHTSTKPVQKPLIVMGVLLLIVFNIFTLKSLVPMSSTSSSSMALYDYDRAVVPSRAILSDRNSNRRNSYETSGDNDYATAGNRNDDNNPSDIPSYPYIQCVAYINKTHSQRINRELHSLVQDHNEKQQDTQSVIVSDSKSLSLPSNPIVSAKTESSIEPLQHVSRKVARQTKYQSDDRGQLQPYKTYEANYDEFIHTIDRKNDTLYFVSFKRDHLILPATVQNQTQRPKLSLILPASMANLNKSIHVPTNHVPMIKIDCEVEDTKLVFVKRTHIPSSYRNDLFQYYSAASQAST